MRIFWEITSRNVSVFSVFFGSTVDTGLCQSTEVSLGYGLCFATETRAHSAIVQSSAAKSGVFWTAKG